MDYDDFLDMAYEMGIAASPGSRDAVVKYARAVYNAGVMDERERCATLCEKIGNRIEDERPNRYMGDAALECADEIRKMK